MPKIKYLIMILFVIILLLLVPNISNATSDQTYKDETQGIEWEYELDGENVINLRCKTTTKTGKVEIPSQINGKTVISLGYPDRFEEGDFKGCTGIREVTIPNTIKIIGRYAFAGYTGLQSIVIPDSVTKIKEYAFEGCTGLRFLSLSNNLTLIGTNAFADCLGLKSIVIPDSVIEIGERAFQKCTYMESVTLSQNLTYIGEGAFHKCVNLESIVIPDGVKRIERYTFCLCTSLMSVTLSQNLTSIGEYAFSGADLDSVTIPNSVFSIENNAFSTCKSLKELILSNNLSKIGDYTFENCISLTRVKLPDSVKALNGEYSFGGCKNLQKILIPDTVVSIGDNVFSRCSKLTIYGNDGMKSKQYAEAHQIPFDYIANWDKTSSETDSTAPAVENIQVTYPSIMNYSKDANNMYMVPEEAELVINVIFSEAIEGTTVPTLTIKFGDGQNIQLTEGTVNGSTITYIYTVKSTDKGVMTTVDYKGGNIKDAAGNVATLSCPALDVQDSSGIYANGTATNPDNIENNENTNNEGITNVGSNGGTTNENDKTLATGKLPQTGVVTGLITLLIVTIGAGTFSYIKTRKYKGI